MRSRFELEPYVCCISGFPGKGISRSGHVYGGGWHGSPWADGQGSTGHSSNQTNHYDMMKYWEPQVEAIHSYNTMKDNLMEYLAKFASSKKVVREEDIKEFFDGMKKNKKMKTGGPPSSCK